MDIRDRHFRGSMMPHYYLSNRQRKELQIRHAEITIAIPAPDLDDYDALTFVRDALVDVPPQWVRSAEETELRVTIPAGGGLAGVLGAIVPEEHDAAGMLTWCIAAIVATLSVGDRPRHQDARPQWPGDVRVGDWRLSQRGAQHAGQSVTD